MSNEDKPADNGRKQAWEQEENWLGLAIAGAVILAVIGGFLVWWVMSADLPANRLQRVQTVSPLGILAVAAITFFTVVWRGLISARQANTSLQQLDGLTKQIALAEETSLATLLQKGAELLADENYAKRSAGIATLEAVAIAGSDKFTDPARKLLIDFVRANGHETHSGRLTKQAISGVNSGFAKEKTFIDDHLYFEINEDTEMRYDDYATNWRVIEGVFSVRYQGGNMDEQRIIRENMGDANFSHVRFGECFFDVFYAMSFNKCRFSSCTFGRIHTSEVVDLDLRDCNFSGANIVFDRGMPDLREGENFYLAGNPPIAVGNTGPSVVWKDVLLEFAEMGSIEDFT
ncbi:hypothetical protein NKI78_27070 [Mesorhizobium sp. M0400]|uniref:hypothetical protein n=1 Tax=Mesorhizobium sp. M0400 TaxID=2956941 RepID=UPI00333D31DA